MESDAVASLAPLRSNPHLCEVAHTPLLTPDECRDVVAALGDDWVPMRVQVGAGGAGREGGTRGGVRDDVRRGLQQPVPGGDAGDLARRIAEGVLRVNAETFGFRVVGVEARVAVLRYRGETGDRFLPHMDLGTGSSLRKLSFSLLLSDPSSFEGGDLCFGHPIADARVQGSLTVFPSYLPHEVSPVTSGIRDVVVGWVIGPAFV